MAPEEDIVLKQQVEALVFASEEAVTLSTIRHIIGCSLGLAGLDAIVEQLNSEYASSGRSFRIRKIAGGYRFFSESEFDALLKKLMAPKIRKRVSQSMLEVLAVIAYQQPVTKAEILQVRGVSPDYSLDRLLERGFIEVRGRADSPGKPLQYGTTKEFLDLFSLFSLRDLPKLREIEEIIQENEEQEYLASRGGDKDYNGRND
ncbi:SMC-Scp complex subunit ScpB [Chlorobium phaeobacteroides]|jgi:segregation and condensation protein B|uniref:Condensin subunit ScpB n=1 Tax=Chlorobium phaeobacteroides (strain DSM 266 / SMG 266 / 2430) TaxID=290317 RepID=A1BDS3_CHLPD|nr:SMC-Scp complex subunit ScpB [Chlorobium phaeobacteroides]ABL64550.1 condensin subunit ScpB [Chlorobium phaeobacteroides DSM 266]MBV5326551.1 SMC-Scp complex subunit ScpB [Chlorobium sp.]